MKLPRYYVLNLYNGVEHWLPKIIAILLLGFVLWMGSYYAVLSYRAEVAHIERRGEERKTRENFETHKEMQKQKGMK